jgi:hypothetical protein
MRFSKDDAGYRESDCGHYRINDVGNRWGRVQKYELQVLLADGWVKFPGTFHLLRDARDAAHRCEEL